MAWNCGFLLLWFILASKSKTESQVINEKRILLTDPDYADNQQIHRDIQLLKATVNHLQTTVNTLNAKLIGQDQQIQRQDKRIQSQASVITTFQNSKCVFIIHLYICGFIFFFFYYFLTRYFLSLDTKNKSSKFC